MINKNKSIGNLHFPSVIILAFLFCSCRLWAQGPQPETILPADNIELTVQPVHPWRPPFNLEKIGHSFEVKILINAPRLPPGKIELATLLEGTEISRQEIKLSDATPFKGSAILPVNVDQLVLYTVNGNEPPAVLAKQNIAQAPFEFDAVAQPDKIVNPVDLGTILVPEDWLLVEANQTASIDLAMLSRKKNISSVNVTAWYASSPTKKVNKRMNLPVGQVIKAALSLPPNAGTSGNDVLNIAIGSSAGSELWQKQIKVMNVPKQQAWPKFGAVKTKLRYDPPITNIVDGKNKPFSYSNAWKPEKEDYIVFLPNGARWVFWRGSSYIPFWASRFNTGLSYEWAERISPNVGFTDCPEPLMDKELRYGRVEIIESTPSRVHVRWDYQSCDFNYKVNGDFAHEDYYFYPDGLGTRALTLTSIPEAEYEVAEFILLASQAALPLDIMPEKPMDVISLNTGKKAGIYLPEKDSAWKTIEDPAIYRMRIHKKESLAAFSFNPLLKNKPFAFAPFYDKGLVVTPAYWGGHWPLSQGFNTGRAINESIWSGPSHNSLLTWAAKRPQPLHTEILTTNDALDVSKTMRRETYVWLIGMTDANDESLLHAAGSFANPASLQVKGAMQDAEMYASERRAYCLTATGKNISITIKPVKWCINPVFEIKKVTGKLVAVKLAGIKVTPDRYSWDGSTLWINAVIGKAAELELKFGG